MPLIRRKQLALDVTVSASKNPCRLASTGNLGLSGLSAFDGPAPVAGDRILVKNQSTGSQNGIYIAAGGGWTRAVDFDADDDVESGQLVSVSEGTVNADTTWQLQTNAPISLGATALVFDIVSRAGTDPAAHGTDHNPGGSDPITTATATGLDGDTSNATGTDTSLARSDHLHAIDTTNGSISTINAGDSAVEGSGTGLSRRDHQHAIATAAPGTIEPDDTATEGASSSLARADHTHAIVAAAPSTGLGASNAEGSSTSFARADHDHTIRESGGQDLTVGAISNSDVVIRTGTVLVGVSSINSAQHGNQALGDGNDHGLATGATAGFMTPADFTKLASLEALTAIDAKESVLVRAQGNIALTGEQTIDGILTSTSRVLLDQQSTALQDGIYITDGSGWTRSADMAIGTEARGVRVWVEEGTIDGSRLYACSNVEGSDVVNTDGLTFSLIGAGSPRGAGEGLNLNGNDIEISPGDASITTTATTVSVGVLQSDAQHGDLGNGSLHTVAAAGGNAGFLSGADKTLLDSLTSGAEPNLTRQQEEITTEAISGSDTAISDTLAATPDSAGGFTLYLNGLLQQEGAGNDYTRSTITITWLASSGTAVDLDTSDELLAVYDS